MLTACTKCLQRQCTGPWYPTGDGLPCANQYVGEMVAKQAEGDLGLSERCPTGERSKPTSPTKNVPDYYIESE